MVNTVYWCPHCKIPVVKNEICPLCGTTTKPLSTTGVCNPVFAQEKRLLSLMLGEDLMGKDVWYLGSSYYLIDGVRKRLPYVDFYKRKAHLEIADELRSNISNSVDTLSQRQYLIGDVKK